MVIPITGRLSKNVHGNADYSVLSWIISLLIKNENKITDLAVVQ